MKLKELSEVEILIMKSIWKLGDESRHMILSSI